MAPTHSQRWLLAAATLVCALFQAQLRAQTIRWQPDVASDAWRTHSKQTGGGTRNTVEQAVVRGKPCLLLHDNDPKLSTNLDTTLDLPDSGLVKGLTLFPATHGDQPNRPNAYLALQLFPKTGGTSIFLTFRRADGTKLKLPLTVNPVPNHHADVNYHDTDTWLGVWTSLLQYAGYSIP